MTTIASAVDFEHLQAVERLKHIGAGHEHGIVLEDQRGLLRGKHAGEFVTISERIPKGA